ncbi:MAG: hypothetical protein L3J38_07805, partial [Thiomicrorhabdus sp.]|nr:hypothetical protein [Thiomicrorhabdus sp.]
YNYKFNKLLFASLIILFISSCSTSETIEDEEILPLEAIEILNVSYGTSASQKYDFDDRYQNQVDDDFDWDGEFDKMDSEMSVLDKQYQTKKEADSKRDPSNESPTKPSDSTEFQAKKEDK